MTEEKKFKEDPPKNYGYGIRHVQVLCMWLCMVSLFVGRSTLGVAILAMTDDSRRNDSNIEIYNWDKQTQGYVLSSFYGGYMVMQVPAGVLAKKYGGRLIMLVALLANGALCLVFPIVAHYGGWVCLCICRMCMGLTQACLFPASHTMCGRWLPPSERTRLSAFVYAGNSIGIIIAMPLSGYLAETALGWKMIFYATGAIMFITAGLWYWFAASSPTEHRMISEEEINYIEKELKTSNLSNSNLSTPWGAIVRTVPMWAIAVAQFGGLTAFTVCFIDLPTYLDKALHISLKNSATLSALPHIGGWAGSVLSGIVCEKICNRKLLSIVVCRKIFTTFALFGAATGYTILAFLTPEQKGTAIVVAMATFTLIGCVFSGFMVNHLDLSPQFAGVLLSITNLAGAFTCLVTPIVTSVILQNDPSNIYNWRVVFLVVAGVAVTSNVFYLVFGSADRQPWDMQHCDLKNTADEMKPLKEPSKEQETS